MTTRICRHISLTALHNALGIVLCLCVLCACNRVDAPEAHLYVSAGVMAEADGGELTRGIYTGYEAFDAAYDAATADRHSIGLFVARDDKDPVYSVFTYQGVNRWSSLAEVQTGVDHYIYGMMPTCAVADHTAARLTHLPSSSSYANGAVLTVPGIPAVSDRDLCIVTGVAKGVVADTVQGIRYVDLVPGVFKYHASYTDNYLYLLFDHLYSRINLRFYVDADYFDVHAISLDTVRVSSLEGASDYTASVSLRSNTEKKMPMTPSFQANGTAGCTALVHSADTLILPTDLANALEVPVYVCPVGVKKFRIDVVYDIYDKQNHIVSPKRRASNTFSVKAQGAVVDMEPGKAYNLPLLIQPSYLYDLSDPDGIDIKF